MEKAEAFTAEWQRLNSHRMSRKTSMPGASARTAAGSSAARNPALPTGDFSGGAPERRAEKGKDTTEIWVALERRDGYLLGEEVSLEGRRFAVEGDRGWVEVPGPPSVLVAIAREGTTEGVTPRAAEEDDLRTLPVRYDQSGNRGRPFGSGVEALSETPMPDWRISGPRTTLWLARAFCEGGHSPTQRHYWWRSILGLAGSDPGVDEHRFIAECIEQAVTIN